MTPGKNVSDKDVEDIEVAPSKTASGKIYVMAYRKTLSIGQAKAFVRKLRDAISEADRLRSCMHLPGWTYCPWCEDKYG